MLLRCAWVIAFSLQRHPGDTRQSRKRRCVRVDALCARRRSIVCGGRLWLPCVGGRLLIGICIFSTVRRRRRPARRNKLRVFLTASDLPHPPCRGDPFARRNSNSQRLRTEQSFFLCAPIILPSFHSLIPIEDARMFCQIFKVGCYFFCLCFVFRLHNFIC